MTKKMLAALAAAGVLWSWQASAGGSPDRSISPGLGDSVGDAVDDATGGDPDGDEDGQDQTPNPPPDLNPDEKEQPPGEPSSGSPPEGDFNDLGDPSQREGLD